jgi:2-dehydro-3-deoxyglucarate aldolase
MSTVGRKLFQGRNTVFGTWTSFAHPSITEIFGRSGADFVGIDIEHSTIDQEQCQRIIAAAQSCGVQCLPRVASHNGEMIKRLLDSGADGVIVPMVSTPAEVEQIAAWTKYPPLGRRSYGMARAQGYGFDFERYTSEWNERSSVIIQIESVTGCEHAEALIGHPAVDGAMIGPYDLSGSLGIPGQLRHPRLVEMCSRVGDICRRMGKAFGTQLIDPTPEDIRRELDAGYTFIVLASDLFVLWKWSERTRATLAAVRAEAGS